MTEKCPVDKGQKKRWVTCVRDRGMGELSLVWKTECEAQQATNVMAVGGGTTHDVGFRVYRESNAVRRGLKD